MSASRKTTKDHAQAEIVAPETSEPKPTAEAPEPVQPASAPTSDTAASTVTVGDLELTCTPQGVAGRRPGPQRAPFGDPLGRACAATPTCLAVQGNGPDTGGGRPAARRDRCGRGIATWVATPGRPQTGGVSETQTDPSPVPIDGRRWRRAVPNGRSRIPQDVRHPVGAQCLRDLGARGGGYVAWLLAWSGWAWVGVASVFALARAACFLDFWAAW